MPPIDELRQTFITIKAGFARAEPKDAAPPACPVPRLVYSRDRDVPKEGEPR
jgi:hypothetical protein